jgi:predicted secreted protein
MGVEDILIGLEYLAFVDTAESDASPVWVELPHQTDCNLNTNQNKVDATTKQGAGWRQQVGTGKAWDADCSGMLEAVNTALDYFDVFKKSTTMNKRMHIRIRRVADNHDHEGWAFADIAYAYPAGEKATYSLTWEGDGALIEQTGV